ncbi:TBC domain protein, Rab GTPase activator [Pseudohyphozyma bogoriensis]|nr:TBC domain protein, Rab GTPase activator [Pseudohyphozyma bogoriensis]
MSLDGSYVLPPTRAHPVAPTSTSSTPPATVAADPLNASGTPPRSKATTQREVILKAVESEDVDTLTRVAGEPGGFLDNELRKRVWPLLLGVSQSAKATSPAEEAEKGGDEAASDEKGGLPPHKDEGQVRLDVNRSFVSYPAGVSDKEKEELRVNLEDVIVTVLRRHPALSYFQGYHDIISVLLLTFNDQQLSIRAAERMSLHRIRDSLGTGLEPVLGYLRLLHRILDKVDPELSEIVSIAAAIPYFSLSWVLTLMSHDLTSLNVIARLFDFLLAYNPAMVSYLGIILLKKEELAALDEDSADDPAILHHTLSKLPKLTEPTTFSTPPPSELDTDEDLMSSHSRSPSLSQSISTSFLSESVVSLSSSSEDEDGGFSDSMFSDPDIEGLAFDAIAPPTPTLPRSKPVLPWNQPVSLEALIQKTLEIYKKHPLSGEGGINADEVMGSKSCVFTWPLSVEGRLTDEDAEEISRKGVDIVLPEVMEKSKEEVELPVGEEKKLVRKSKKSRRVELGVGTVLTVVGVGVVIFAVYSGGDLKTMRERIGAGRWPWSS